jgi:hypothetical protein
MMKVMKLTTKRSTITQRRRRTMKRNIRQIGVPPPREAAAGQSFPT